ncbi:glycosyltransferase family 4 protein [Xenorhabdus khoisanae]|uniref:glycosyltransferase family 4 protein n=1 Tax=Xenorhabdus khoisanae TaxID=880157 RepID=UPI0032B772CB
MKKTIFVHLYNDFSGSPRVLKEMVTALSNQSENCIITSNSHGILSDIKNVKYKNFTYKPVNNKFLKLLLFIKANLTIFFLLCIEIIKSKIPKNDITIIVNTMLPFGALWAAKVFNVKTIAYVHETSIKPLLLKSFLKFSIKKSAVKVIYVSQYLKDQERFNNIPEVIVPNPVSQELISEGIKYQQKIADRTILFLSSLVKYKGIHDFIKIAKISSSKKDQLNYIMVINSSHDDFNHFIANNKIPENMIVYYRPKSIVDLYAKAAFVLNLSDPKYLVETFGLTLVEGMSNGAVPIGPIIGGPAEIIKSNSGFIIENHKHAEIQRIMFDLLNNPEKYIEFSNSALSDAKKYSLSNYEKNIRKAIF